MNARVVVAIAFFILRVALSRRQQTDFAELSFKLFSLNSGKKFHKLSFLGESVKSDQEPAEHLSHVNQDSEIQTTNFTTPRSEVAAKSTSTRDLSNVYYHQNTPRVVAPSVTHPLQNATVPGHRTNHCVVAPKLYRQASAPPTRSMIQTLPYAASNGSNSTNVTLTRESSRIPSRASTACGSLTTKPLKSNSVFDPAGPVHSQSVSAFHSTPMDPLLNDSLMWQKMLLFLEIVYHGLLW